MPPSAQQSKTKVSARSTLTGGAWALVGTLGQNVLRLLIVVIMARLLTPEEFGVVGAALIVVSFSEVLMHMGIGSALVQSSQDVRAIEGIAMSLSILTTALVVLIVLVSSPALAVFLNVPQLVDILPVMCIVFLVRGLTHPSVMLLNRDMRFKHLALLELATYGFGYGGVAVTLAYHGYSYWSLVIATVVEAVLFGAAIFLMRPVKPRFGWKWDEGAALLHFGSGMLISQLLNNLARKGDNIVVSATMGPAALGLYSRAYALMDLANNVIGTGFYKVLFPAFAELRRSQEKEKLVRAFCAAQGVAAIIIFPVAALMYLLAEDVIRILLGDQWLEVTPILQVLAIGMVLRLGYKVSGSMIAAAGAVYRGALRQGIYAVLVVIGALAGTRYGLTGVATAILIALLWQYVSLTMLCRQLVGFTLRELAVALAPAILSTCLAVFISGVVLLLVESLYMWVRVIAVCFAFAVGYLACLYFFRRTVVLSTLIRQLPVKV